MAKLHLGGQAVLEGVMVRGEKFWAVAVRRPDGEIVVRSRPLNSLSSRLPWLKVFILRGVLALVEAVTLAVQAFRFSAHEAVDGEVEIGGKEIALAMGLAITLAVGLFIVLPTLIARSVDVYLGSTILLNVVEGFIRIAVFLLYIVVVSRMKDVTRVFEYHGAEHKVINTYESGKSLTPEATARYSPLHLRCGTSFLLVVMVMSILVFSFLGRPGLLLRIVSRLLIVPLVAGLSYEIIKLSARHENFWLFKIITAPGLWLQKLTTREPSRKQLEVAIASVKKVLELEEAEGKEEVEVALS